MNSLMTNSRIKIFLSIILIATMLFMVTSAWSKSTRYCVQNQSDDQSSDPDSGTQWFNGMVFHLKGSVGDGTSTGDIVAKIDYILNMEINFNTFKGHIYSKQTLSDAVINVVGVGELEGGFDGEFNASLIWHGQGLLEWEGKYIAHGSGDFEGMKLFQTVTGYSPLEQYVGFILDPNGMLPDMPCP